MQWKKLLKLLKGTAIILSLITLNGWSSTAVMAEELGYPEKEELTFGSIKLTDMAPIAIAYEKSFFEGEGLYVTIEAQAKWKVELDGAHILAGHPIAATMGFGTEAEIITFFSKDLSGNGITVPNSIWEQVKRHPDRKRQAGAPDQGGRTETGCGAI